MTTKPRRPISLFVAIGILALADLRMLAGVSRNREGTPRAELALTEREVSLPPTRDDEDSSLFLDLRLGTLPDEATRVAWARGVRLPRHELAWLDAPKLASLGFAVPVDGAPAGADPPSASRRVFVALEFEGESWARFLAAREAEVDGVRRAVAAGTASRRELEDAEALLALDREKRSRLLPIDAARDAAGLAARPPDRRRVAVLPALLTVHVIREEAGQVSLRPFLELRVGSIHVPHRMRGTFAPWLPRETPDERDRRLAGSPPWPAPAPPRYRATVAWGRRHEPWLVAVEPAGR